MAKFVIAGKANCPYYARIELLADDLQAHLDDFQVHKIVKNPKEWQDWLDDTCQKNGWDHKKSPIVWRELIDRGGKGVLIGGSNEFQEYASGYYGFTSKQMSKDMTLIGEENMETKLLVTAEEEHEKSLSQPVHICITNASSPVAYQMIHEIARGDVLGKNTEVTLRLLTDDSSVDIVKGNQMESIDLACTLLRDVMVTTDPRQAFKDASAVIFLDEIPKEEGMEQSDWLKKNEELFTSYGKVLNECAHFQVKAIVAGNGPVNFNALMLGLASPAVVRQNVVAMSRLHENRAKAAIGRRINVNTAGVVDLLIWGNVGGTTYVDLENARVHGYEGAIWGPPTYSRPVKEVVHDDKWLETEYLESLKQYQETVEGALNHRASSSTAHCVMSLLTDWWTGTSGGVFYSLGVFSEGWYDLPEGIVFSLPVKFQEGTWEVIQDLTISLEARAKLDDIADELKKEKEVIFPPPKITPPPASEDENAKKVFGGEGGKGETSPSPDITQPLEAQELPKQGPLTSIVEESETESRDGTTTGTDRT